MSVSVAFCASCHLAGLQTSEKYHEETQVCLL